MFSYYLLIIFWFIRQIKAILFWLNLWQLKNYHWGRFLDHFRTHKGKKIFLNWFLFLKIILLFFFIIYFYSFEYFNFASKNLLSLLSGGCIFILVTIYLFESFKFFLDIFQNYLKKPRFTFKIIIIFFVNLIVSFAFLLFIFLKIKSNIYWLGLSLLFFDVLFPFLVSTIVLFFQPFTVFLRKKIIKKAKEKRKKFKDLIVIAIVGSYGKTSTKEFLATILEENFGKEKVLKTKENQNSEVAIAQSILDNLKENHKFFVCEIGAYNKGKVREVCSFLKPKIGIITGINEQHLATFGSIKNLLSAEGGEELIENLPAEGLLLLNWDNEMIKNLKTKIKKYNPSLKTKFCSRKEKVNLWAEEINIEKEKIFFKVFSEDGDFANFKINLLGIQNVENVLLAACCAKELGIKLEEASKNCQKLKSLPHQMELKKGINEIEVIDSTYSTNPQAVIAHLEHLKLWSGKKIIIMPCLIELGKASKEIHKKIGEKIAQICDLAIITTKDRFKEIKEKAKEKAIFLEKSEEILEKIKNFYQKENVILLEGRISEEIIKKITISKEHESF